MAVGPHEEIPLGDPRKDYWRQLFNKYDRDKDGKISFAELKTIIDSQQYDRDLPENVHQRVLAMADKDSSGYLDYEEFVQMAKNSKLRVLFGRLNSRFRDPVDDISPDQIEDKDPKDLWKWGRLFDKYDRDKDGRISYCELKAIINSHQYDKDLPANVTCKIMKLADTDSSGYLDFAEFVEMMEHPQLKVLFGRYVASYVHHLIPHREQYRDDTDGRYEEEYTCWPPAICMIIISLVEIVLFCYDAAHGKMDATGNIARVFIYNPHKRHEAWRFITYMLVHVGVMHLLVNLLVQLFLGIPLEMVHRWWRVTLVYLAGVAAGSLATSLTDPKVYLAGASGGVYALIAAHVATIIMNWKQMDFAIIQLLVFLLLATVDVGTAVYERYWRNMEQNIGYVAHLAGAVAVGMAAATLSHKSFVQTFFNICGFAYSCECEGLALYCGLLVGIGVLRNLEKRKWEKRLWWAAVLLYVSLMFAGILANIFWTSRFA